MGHYELRFSADPQGEQEAIAFSARSVADALERAKQVARLGWGELYNEGKPICRLRLTEATGVWRVEPISNAQQGCEVSDETQSD